MITPRYGLLALDLDGTLLDPLGRVTQASRQAVADARAAGMVVTICTGRGLVECMHVVDAIGAQDPVIVAGGSIIARPDTAQTLHRFPIDLPLAARAVRFFVDRGHAALVFKDASAAGFDYLVVSPDGESRIDPVTLWWFKEMKVKHRLVPTLEHDTHPETTVRVGVCASTTEVLGFEKGLRAELGDLAQIHVYPAVMAPDEKNEGYVDPGIAILEVFDRAATKWTAIEWLANHLGLDPAGVAAIGDQVNDVPMIRAAGLGVAMGNAVPAVKALAKRVTLDNASDGVAHAIARILAGEW